MDLTDIQAFVVLSEELHFGRAAERLSYTTPNLSRRIDRLERRLHVRLFERTSRRVQLSPAGAAILPDAQAVLASLSSMCRRSAAIATDERREVRIVYSPGVGSVTALLVERIQASMPSVTLRVDLQSCSKEVVQTVEQGHAGIGIGGLRSAHLNVLTLAVVSYSIVYLPLHHRLAQRDAVYMQDLDQEPIVLFERAINPPHYDQLVASFTSMGIRPRFNPCHNIASPVQMLEMVAVGQGIALMTQVYECPPGVTSVPMAGDLPPSVGVHFLWSLNSYSTIIDAITSIAREFADDQCSSSGHVEIEARG